MLIDDFQPSRDKHHPAKKPKIVQPLAQPERPTIHELAAREGHDLNASGPEATAASAFVGDHSKIASSPTAVKQAKTHLARQFVKDASEATIEFDNSAAAAKKAKRGWRQKFTKRLSKKQWIIAASVLVVIVIAGGAGFALKWPAKSNPIEVNAVAAKPKPKPIYSPLSGLPVTAAQAAEPVTGVMIENSIPARPQSGLSQAGVVYEAIAEAGITRFLALFQGADPSSIGPVRSARPYFVSWDNGYDAPYAHVGGSPDGLADIQAWGVKDMNQFYAGSYYQRISSREAPHNVYTSMSELHQLEASRGWSGPSNFTGFARKDASPLKSPNAGTINMNPSSPDYAVSYTYNAKDNNYVRSEGGTPHIDAGTNQQIAPTVVVALIIPYSYGALDSSGAYYSVYNNVGSGPAYVFQDGGVSQVTWSKASNSAPLELLDASGQNVKLDRGQTWLTALANAGQLSYTP